MLIDDYMNYLNENYEIYDEANYKHNYRPAGKFPDKEIIRADKRGKHSIQYSAPNSYKNSLQCKYRRSYDGKHAVKDGRFFDNTAFSSVYVDKNDKRLGVPLKKDYNIESKRKNKNFNKKLAIGAAGIAAAAGAVYGAKKIHDHIKAKRAAKAKEVAVEEGVSLEEAYGFILECEMDLINEGYELYEIYEE